MALLTALTMLLRQGVRVARPGWDAGRWVELRRRADDKNTRTLHLMGTSLEPILITNEGGGGVTPDDLAANDWQEV